MVGSGNGGSACGGQTASSGDSTVNASVDVFLLVCHWEEGSCAGERGGCGWIMVL